MKILLFILTSFTLFAQVNTEELRKFDTTKGIHHKVDFGFGLSKGNTELMRIKGSYRIDYLFDDWNIFYIMNYAYQESNENKIQNKGFAHLRAVKEMKSWLKSEAFIQKEFNEFILIKDRNLVGSGLRVKPFSYHKSDTNYIRFFLGSGIMYEYEYLNIDSNQISNFIRSTSYVTLDWKLNNIVHLISITYLQFVLDNFKDHRLLNETSLNFKISDNLKFYFQINYRKDNQPPSIIDFYDLEINNGITIEF